MTKDEIKQWQKDNMSSRVDSQRIYEPDGNVHDLDVYKIGDKLFAIYFINTSIVPVYTDEKGYDYNKFELVEVEKHVEMIEEVTYHEVRRKNES